MLYNFFFQAEDGIRDSSTSRGLGDVYKRQLSLSVSFAGWRETQAKEDDKMSDERMTTMDEDEEIGQVRFVDYIYVLCFSLFLLSLIHI